MTKLDLLTLTETLNTLNCKVECKEKHTRESRNLLSRSLDIVNSELKKDESTMLFADINESDLIAYPGTMSLEEVKNWYSGQTGIDLDEIELRQVSKNEFIFTEDGVLFEEEKYKDAVEKREEPYILVSTER